MRSIGRVAALLVATALAGWQPGESTAREQLVIGVTQFPSTFHPNIDAMLAKTYIHSMTARPFTAYDPGWELIAMLATRLPTLENGLAVPETTPDGKQGVAVTYTIQPDAAWGDGTPVTTRDVVFTWEVGRHPKSGVGNMEFYRSLYAVDVVDEKTFTFHFDKLTFEYNAINDFDLVPAHLDATRFDDPGTYRSRTTYDTDTTNPGLYFGPYRITQVGVGSHVVLEPNPTWYGPAPHFKKIVVRVIENTAALEANLLSGAIDMIAGELGLTVDQALALERRRGERFRFLYKPGLIYEHIDLNLDNPVLGDPRVRRALVHALDREAISQQLFQGRQPVAHTSVSPLDWVAADDLPVYAYDPEEAARLLDEVGWKEGGGGARQNEDGERLSLEIMTTAGNRTRELVQQALQSQWREAGIDVRIRNEPARVFFGQTMTQRKFEAMAMYAWISSPENVPRSTLHSSHIPTEENNFAGQNYPGFRNEEMDALLERIEVELDRGKRKALWRRLQEIYVEEVPVIPLYFRADAFVLPPWLEGVVPTGHQDPTTLWVEQWRSR